jgi:4'-phosphopantetheinyl transferase
MNKSTSSQPMQCEIEFLPFRAAERELVCFSLPDCGVVDLHHVFGDVSPEIFRTLEPLLIASELQRAVRLRRPEDRRRAVAARALTRLIAATYLRNSPGRILLCFDSYNKPYIREPKTNLRFNMSHSRDEILWGFSTDREIGVDLEVVRPIPEYQLIADEFMSVDEKKMFQSMRAEEKAALFLSWWTQKEACVKASGRGLSLPTSCFSVPIVCGTTQSRVVVAKHTWELAGFKIGNSTAGAFAVSDLLSHVRARTFNINDLASILLD